MRLSDGPTLYHPGDSYAEVPDAVDVLALPLNAPWARVSETLDFVRRVSPTVVVPIHDGLLSEAGRAAYLMHVEGFSPDHTEVRDLADGKLLSPPQALTARQLALTRHERRCLLGRQVDVSTASRVSAATGQICKLRADAQLGSRP